jgi:hypothetical protein
MELCCISMSFYTLRKWEELQDLAVLSIILLTGGVGGA